MAGGSSGKGVVTLAWVLSSFISFYVGAQDAGSRFEPREATKEFREIVVHLSQNGDLTRGAAELGNLERKWDSAGFFSRLAEAEREFIEYLASRSPLVAFPLAELFRTVHDYHLERGRSHLSHHAMRLVSYAGDLYTPGRQTMREIGLHGDSPRSVERPSVISRNLSRIALSLMHGEKLDEAVESFLRPAVRADPNSTIPLHLLAAVSEKRDRFSEAMEHLDKLLAIAPEDAHGRLRRAMIQTRMGEMEAALEQFVGLMADDLPPEVELVVIQEVVDLYVKAGNADLGIELLRKGLLRFPFDQSLRTLQIWLLPDESTEAISIFTDLETSESKSQVLEESTPRVTYNNWPRAELRDLELKRLEDLQPALRALRVLLGVGDL